MIEESIPVAASRPPPMRLEFLDALRGLAALSVVIYHTALMPAPNPVVPRWAEIVVLNGGMGIALFFVVSSFSLFFTMPMRLREPNPWASFFVHRFFRIAPLFYLWLLLTPFRDKFMQGISHDWEEIAASASFIFNLVPRGQQGVVWASWTIGVEMLFYVLFPLFYLFAKNRWQALTLTLWLLIGWTAIKGLLVYFPSEPATRDMFVSFSFPHYLPVFGCGAIAYHLLMPNGQLAQKPWEFGVALSTLAIAILLALLSGWLPSIFGEPFYWEAVAFMLLLLGLGWAPVKPVVNTFTRYLGRISYSLYLNHPSVILLICPIFPWFYRQGLGNTVSFFACLSLTLASAIGLSELTYRFVELPGMQLGKKVNLALRNRLAPVVD